MKKVEKKALYETPVALELIATPVNAFQYSLKGKDNEGYGEDDDEYDELFG